MIGYFNLFQLHGQRNEYLLSDPESGVSDDRRFAAAFGPERCEQLPFTALHLGRISQNWAGPKTSVRMLRGKSKRARFSEFLSKLPLDPHRRTAVQIGCSDPETTQTLSAIFETVILVDVHEVFSRSDDVLEETDRRFVRDSFLRRLNRRGKVILAATESQRCADLPTLSEEAVDYAGIGLIFLEGEPHCDLILSSAARWLVRVCPECWIAGSQFGYPAFPRSTKTVELLLGSPQRRDPAGRWALRTGDIPRRANLDERGRAPRAEENCGVVLWVGYRRETPAAIAALHSIRRSWHGPLTVLDWNADSSALRSACAHFRAAYVSALPEEVGEASEARHILKGTSPKERPRLQRSFAKLASLHASPYEKTCYVCPFSSAPNFEQCFSDLDAQPLLIHSTQNDPAAVLGIARSSPEIVRWLAHLARNILSERITSMEDLVETFPTMDPRAAHAWIRPEPLATAEAAFELAASVPSRVWLPGDVSIVTVITDGDLPATGARWPAIAWPKSARRIAIPMLNESGVENWLPPGWELLAMEPELAQRWAQEDYWIGALAAAVRVVQTQWLIYLDPLLMPSAGAELFREESESRPAYCGGGFTFVRRGGHVLKIPKIGPPATLFDTGWLRRCLNDFSAEPRSSNVETFLYETACTESRPPTAADLTKCGWGHSHS